MCSRFLFVLLLISAPFQRQIFSQSLSIGKNSETNYVVQASAPLDDPHVLQASANLHLWIDLQDPIQNQYTYQFNPTDIPQRYFRIGASSPPAPPIRVLLIGDSMTADCCGWGAGIYGYFKPNATVVNYATPWASTKVFLASAEYDKMMLIQPDYVLVQYGFMDGGTDPDRNTTPDEYAENLRTIVRAIRSFNGVPILITLHADRVWDDQGKIIPEWQSRNDITKAIAAELNTPLIDLNKLSMDLLNKLGQAGSQFMELVPGDTMHVSYLGAIYFSQLVVNALPDSLGPYLTGIFDPPPKP